MSHRCNRHFWDRREFLFRSGGGISGLALAYLLQKDGLLAAESDGLCDNTPLSGNPYAPKAPHFKARAKSVIWIFLSGGYSHLETFDPKPALNRYAGMTFAQTPYANPLTSPLHDRRSRSVLAAEINEGDDRRRIGRGRSQQP